MSQRRQPGEWVLVASGDSAQPQPALIQPPTHAPEPCFDCDDGACLQWPLMMTPGHGPSRIRSVSECQMTSVPKSFSGLSR